MLYSQPTAEVSPNNRAGCKNQECKAAGIKINKGEFRYGTLITIQDHTSWSYKHWYASPYASINSRS